MKLKKVDFMMNNIIQKSVFSSTVCPRPFEEIPGPKALPLIGTLYKYLPIIGEYDLKNLPENGRKKFFKYGPLVREEIVKGEPIVWVFRPEDIAEVFNADKRKFPERRSHRALYKYRKDRPEVYNTGGLLTTNGENWWRLRKEFQKPLSRPKNISNYIPCTDSVIKNFVKICRRSSNSDILPLLARLNLELTCLVAFDFKIDSFSEKEMKKDSMSSRLLQAAITTNELTIHLDNGPKFWRWFNTPMYSKLCSAQMYMEKVAIQLVTEKQKTMKNSDTNANSSLLEFYLQNPNLDFKDVIGMACDMLLAGVETTTYTSSFLLYHLATHPQIQDKLFEESSKLLPQKDDPITVDILGKATYTKAVMKENYRLNPISVGVGRLLQDDIILNSFIVPKGTNVVTQNQISCRMSEYFENPDCFVPERWLRNSEKEKPFYHPYLVLPFGHGPRSCIARRFAEQIMQILFLRMCRHLYFSWCGGEFSMESFIINKPKVPMELSFRTRD